MKIVLSLELPSREQSSRSAKAHKPQSAEEKIRDCITMVESGEASRTEWLTLIKLNNELVRKYQKSKISKREVATLKKLHKVLEHLAPDTNEEVLQVASLMHPRK
jgi:hypothetical protein